jgi:hypothetical protein
MAKQRPKRSLAVVQANLASYSRTPFLEVLAKFMHCAPTMEAIREFANKSPDKWANAVRALGTLAGYTEKIDITQNNIFLNIHNMSDSELMQALSQRRPVIEHLPLIEEVQPGSTLGEVSHRNGQNSATSGNENDPGQKEKTP